MKILTEDYEIERQGTKIKVPHKDSYIKFIYQRYGPNTYMRVKKLMEKDGLLTSTIGDTTSLLYEAFVNDSEGKQREFNEIKDIMKTGWLWTFTGVKCLPSSREYSKGVVYIEDNPEFLNNKVFMDESDLLKKLYDNESSVRFIPFGFKIGEMSPGELSKNEFIKGLTGDEELAEKLAEISGKHKNEKPYLFGFNSVNIPLTRISALGSNSDSDYRLIIDTYYLGDLPYGCAFGRCA